MSVTHQPDPIVDPERLFEGFENLMPFRVQNPFSDVRKKKQCHPERSGCFAKRSRCGVEGPRVSVGRDKCGKAFSQACPVRIPCDSVAKVRITRSFDCVIVHFANDHFAQDDNSMATVSL
jgi:hypothetical protein